MKLKSILTIFLAAVMTTVSVCSVYAAGEVNNGFEIQTGEYSYYSFLVDNTNLTDTYYYSDGYFVDNAYTTNTHLATFSIQMASAACGVAGADFANQSNFVTDLLGKIGFTDIAVNDYYKTEPTATSMGVACAKKTININGQDCTVIAVVPRSGNYYKEWVGNFLVGTGDEAEGFTQGRDVIIDYIKNYITTNSISGWVKLWIPGYSRGAAVTNLTAAYLDRSQNALGIEIKPEDIYAYCFETPATVISSSDYYWACDYGNIHNYICNNDLVTMLPLEQWGYTVYGTLAYADLSDASHKNAMMGFISDISEAALTSFTTSYDPDVYSAKKISYGSGGITFVDDADSVLEKDTESFLEGRMDVLYNGIASSPQEYVDGGYQQAAQTIADFIFSLDSTDEFIAGAETSAIYGALYLLPYYTSELLLNNLEEGETITADDATNWGLYYSAGSMLNMLIKLYMTDIKPSARGEAIMSGPLVEALSTKASTFRTLAVADNPDLQLLTDTLRELNADVKNIADSLLQAAILDGADAVKAAGGTVDDTALSKVSSTETIAPISKLLAYLVFGSENVQYLENFTIECSEVQVLSTLAGNNTHLVGAHLYEPVTAWVKTYDSYWTGEEEEEEPSPEPAPEGGEYGGDPEHYETLVQNDKGGFDYYLDGVKDTSKYGFVDYDGGRFLVVGGSVATNKNGLVQDPDNENIWYFCAHGQVQLQYSGLALYDGEWFCLNSGELDTTYSGFVTYDGAMFLVAAGRLLTKYNGLWQYSKSIGGDDKWYFIAAGMVVTYYSGPVYYDGQWFRVKTGVLVE